MKYWKQENGYVLTTTAGQPIWSGERVSLAVREATGELVDHGDPEKVAQTVAKSPGSGIMCICGEFPVSELNHMLDVPRYAGTYVNRLMAIAIKAAETN